MKTISVFGLTALIFSFVSSQIPDADVPPPPEEKEIILEPELLEDEWAVAPPPPLEETETEKKYSEILMDLKKKGSEPFITTIDVDEWKLILIVVPQD